MHEIKNEKNYILGFRITKIWQIFKCFSRALTCALCNRKISTYSIIYIPDKLSNNTESLDLTVSDRPLNSKQRLVILRHGEHNTNNERTKYNLEFRYVKDISWNSINFSSSYCFF